jgi:hypothetical protein
MSFLLPLYLAGAALAVLPIVLHLLRRDVAPPVPFTAVHLLQRTSGERARRFRLRDWLLLAARIAALLLLAASFARPYRPAAPGLSRTTVVAVDRSFSMASPARMARARELARQAIDDARGDRIFVVAFDDRAELLSASGTATDARAAADAVAAGFGATRYAAAFDKAAEILLDDDKPRLVIVSDLQRSGFDQSGAAMGSGLATLPEGIDLVVRDAGAATENLSVSNVTIDHHQVTVTVRNAGERAFDSDVAVTADDRALGVKRVSIPGNDAVAVRFEAGTDVTRVSAAVMHEASDGYAADNTRYAVRDARTPPRVLIVSGAAGSRSGFYLTRALLAEGDEGPDFAARTVSGPAFSAMKADDLRDDSAIVLLSTHGLDRRAGESLRRFLQAGGGVLIAAAPDVDAAVLSVLFDWSPVLEPADVDQAGVLAATDLRHPVLRPFDAVAANFGQVAFDHAWKIEARGPWRVVARFTSGAPALAERTGGPGRLLLFTSDVDRRWNDFPLHASFVPFAQEAARYLAGRAPVTSGFVVADVPAGVPPRPGLVERDGRTMAVNVDPRESRVDRVTAAEFRSLVTRTAAPARARGARRAADTERQQLYWRYGLMLMLVTLVLEAFVGSR